MLNDKLDNVTEELVKLRTSVLAIEENTEVRVTNGWGIDVPMKTNEVIKHLYENVRPGGLIDAKFAQCKVEHSTINMLGKFNKNAGVFVTTFKMLVYVLFAGAILYGLYTGRQRDKKEDAIANKVEQLERLIK
jgi:hypothetical protein